MRRQFGFKTLGAILLWAVGRTLISFAQVAHNICTFVGNGKVFADNIQNFSMNAYRRVDLVETGVMVGGELVGERPVEQVIGKLFEDPHVKYLHARTATVGCFVARVERA